MLRGARDGQQRGGYAALLRGEGWTLKSVVKNTPSLALLHIGPARSTRQ